MAEKIEKWYPGEGKLTLGWGIIYVVLVLGLIAACARLFLGLGATTNLSDGYPWGLWVSFDILAGVALAVGGLAVGIHYLNKRRAEIQAEEHKEDENHG